MLGVYWQKTLEPLQCVDEEKAHDAEGQERGRVLAPALFGAFLHPDEFVGERFQWPQHRMNERATAFKEFRHEFAHRFGEDRNYEKENNDLQNAVGCHLEFLRLQQGVDEVGKKKDCGSATNQIVHKFSVRGRLAINDRKLW